MIKVSIIGATGYTGSELLRLLVPREDIQIVTLTSQNNIGTSVEEYYPFLTDRLDLQFAAYDKATIFKESDVVFVCLPHGHAMTIAQDARGTGTKVIDMGADFRIKDSKTYENYYHVEQTAPEILDQAVYGLPEKYREAIKSADVVANPGCFVTACLLALLPAMTHHLYASPTLIVDGKSGITGAGRKPAVNKLYSELSGNAWAYNVTGHRHTPEMEQELSSSANEDITVQFTPQVIPTERGIMESIYVPLKEGTTEDEVRQIYSDFYKDEPFVHLLPKGQMPEIKSVRGSNNCYLQVVVNPRTHQLMLFSVLDNLVKGAAGQAIQNMNLMFGLDETTGLTETGMVP